MDRDDEGERSCYGQWAADDDDDGKAISIQKQKDDSHGLPGESDKNEMAVRGKCDRRRAMGKG